MTDDPKILQKYSKSLYYPTHPCNSCTHSSLRSLLQEFPAFHPDSHLRHDTRHLTRPNSTTRHLLIDTSCLDYHTKEFSRRSFVPLYAHDSRQLSADLATATYVRRNCILFFINTSTEILSTTPAFTITVFATTKWPHHHGL